MRFFLLFVTLFLGISCENGVCMVRGSHDIDPLEHIHRNLPTCLNASKAAQGRDIIVFVGNTGAGKSTCINILAGVRMLPSAYV